MVGFSIYGCYNLSTDIDIKWLFHPDSYAVKFIDQREAVCNARKLLPQSFTNDCVFIVLS